MKTDVLGVSFDNISLQEAIDAALLVISEHEGGYVVTPNPEIVMLAGKKPQLMDTINGAKLVLADGIGVVYSAKILGTPLKERVAGIDFATGLMERLAQQNGSVYLFGAKPGVAEEAADNLEETYPGLAVCGTHDGYFDDDTAIIEDINSKKPDFLMVCLGCPKQEYWISENVGRLDVGIMAGLGGCLDVFAGKVDRAPEKMQQMGLEWLYRLGREPKRIGRMIKLPGILFKAAGQRVRGKENEQG